MIQLANGLTLCYWGEQQRASREEIASILSQCGSDDSALLELRALLHHKSGMAGTDLLDRDQLLERIASLIQSGDLLLFGTPVHRAQRSLGKEPVRTFASAPPPRRAAPARAAPPAPADPPVIPPNVNRAALIAVMQNAAASGVPFCDT
jgi:hypothetical protein